MPSSLPPTELEKLSRLVRAVSVSDKIAKAKKLGQELLKRFPDHAETMEALGELCMDTKDYKEKPREV